VEIVQKLENQIKVLQERNESLIKIKETDHNNEEFKKLKKDYMDLRVSLEESQRALVFQKKLNKDYESKVKLLEEENLSFSQKFKELKEKLKKYGLLKEKIVEYKNELKYKDSMINYLENSLITSRRKDNDNEKNEEAKETYTKRSNIKKEKDLNLKENLNDSGKTKIKKGKNYEIQNELHNNNNDYINNLNINNNIQMKNKIQMQN